MEKLVRVLFGLLGVLSPSLGARLAFRFFFTPFKANHRSEEQKMAEKARSFEVTAAGKKCIVREWGAEGPVVLFAHGWSSKGLHFRKFIKPLVDQGYRVVIPDFPGHVNSEGKQTNVLEFKELIIELYRMFPVEALVTHSLGGLAATLSLIETEPGIKKWVMMNSATESATIMKRFMERVGGNQRIEDRFRKLLLERFNEDFRFFSIAKRIDEIHDQPEMLIVADTEDIDAPLSEAKALADHLKCGLMITEGLGHNKAIRDDRVVDDLVSFLTKKPDE